MKNFITILLFAITAFISNKATAQLSDSLYDCLGPDTRPAKKESMSVEERLAFISEVNGLCMNLFHDEITRIVDSAKTLLETTNNQNLKVRYASVIAEHSTNFGRYDDAFNYYRQAIQYANNDTAFYKYTSAAYAQLGSFYTLKTEPDSAINCLHKAQDIGNKNDSDFMCKLYNGYQLVYQYLNLYEQSIEYSKKYNDMLTSLYKWGEDYVLTLFRITDDYNNLYRDTKEKKYIDSSLAIINGIWNHKTVTLELFCTRYYAALAQIKYYRGQYKEAVQYYDSALLPANIATSIRLPKIIVRCQVERAVCLVKTGNTASIKILDTIQVGERNFFYLQLIAQTLYEYAKSEGDWKNTLRYFEQYTAYTDSMDIIKTRGKIFESNQKYSVAEKEIAINNLEKEKLLIEKRDNKNRAIAIVIVLALIIAILLLVWYYKQLQLKKEKEKQQLADNLTRAETEMENERAAQQIRQETLIKEQREKISKSLHDEINSGLAALKFYISDLKASAAETKTKEVLGKVEEEASNLYLQAREFMNNLTAANRTTANYNVVSLLDNLAARFNDESILHIINKIDKPGIESRFTPKQHYEMYSIIKESIANIIKHAEASTAIISVSFNENRCNFSITDNGKGFNRQQIIEGLGLKSLESRVVNELHGELKINSTTKGTIITGNFPLEA